MLAGIARLRRAQPSITRAVAKDVARHDQIIREAGHEPVKPIVSPFVYVAETEKEAHQGAFDYMGGYWASADAHDNFSDGHLKSVKSYEHYGVIADNAKTPTPDQAVEGFINRQVAGPPDQCLEQIYAMRDKVTFDHLISVFSYGGMPPELTERSMKLFASEVMPKLQNEGVPVTAEPATEAQIAAK